MSSNSFKSHWKFGLHPVFKLSIYILFNFLIFHPDFKNWMYYFLITEILIALIIKMKIGHFLLFFKFLLVNFIGMYILFYFAEGNWGDAFIIFIEYAFIIMTFSIAAFIFLDTTPTHELIIGLKAFKIPPKLIFALTISVQFLPIISRKIREIIIFQKARGYKLSLFHISPILIPTILSLLDLSMNVSISMKSRGFDI